MPHAKVFGLLGLIATLLVDGSGTKAPASELSESSPLNAAAMALYDQKKYAAAADAFDKIIRTSTPQPSLYYYAALANRDCTRTARARQLCQYIITNFPKSAEATNARALFTDPNKGASDVVPVAYRNKTVEELLKTDDGRRVIETALARKEALLTATAQKVSPMMAKSKGGRSGERVFTAADIGKEGANGIDQMYYPNCWFESSMSALAMLPRGQKLLAEMIRYGPREGTYVLRFPGDGQEYVVTEQVLEQTGVHDKALWATLIECGQTLKFPDDNGNMLSVGLGALTGQQAQTLTPSAATDGEIISFIEGAVRSQNPIVCGSQHSFSGVEYLVFPSHAYTVIGYDAQSCMVKLRNPHGANSRRFSLTNDPNHQRFEQLDDGVCRMHVSLFKHYFAQIARANI